MKFIQTDENGAVQFEHSMPFDSVYGMGKTDAELKEIGYLVTDIPTADTTDANTTAQLFFDKVTKQFYYKYTPRTLSAAEQEIADLKAENAILKLRDSAIQEDLNFIFETLGA